jgi:hypothetical protein
MPSDRRLAPLEDARFRLAARALRAHKRHQWHKCPQVDRLDPEQSGPEA